MAWQGAVIVDPVQGGASAGSATAHLVSVSKEGTEPLQSRTPNSQLGQPTQKDTIVDGIESR